MLWSLKNKMFDLKKAVGFSLWEKCVGERTKKIWYVFRVMIGLEGSCVIDNMICDQLYLWEDAMNMFPP